MNAQNWERVLPWLQLYLTEGLGCLRIARLIEYFGSPQNVIEESAATLSKGLPEKVVQEIRAIPQNKKIQDHLARTHAWLHSAKHHHILCPEDAAYPEALKELPDYPPVLFLSGNINLLNTPQLAIVGSRRPSLQGKTLAEKMARELSLMGLTITSGLAMGIDAAAHYGALAGSRASIAIIGTGLDRVYPAENRLLSRQLTTLGLLISEFPLGTTPHAGNFPKRNRIISGLSLGVLVVEAAEKSGSLITARLALEQGREVFAVPGSVSNPQAKGCHKLIREGAVLVDEAKQVIEELKTPLERWITSPALSKSQSGSESSAQATHQTSYVPIDKKVTCPNQRIILEALGSEVWHIDELLMQISMSQETMTTALTLLELNNIIVLTPHGYQRL